MGLNKLLDLWPRIVLRQVIKYVQPFSLGRSKNMHAKWSVERRVQTAETQAHLVALTHHEMRAAA